MRLGECEIRQESVRLGKSVMVNVSTSCRTPGTGRVMRGEAKINGEENENKEGEREWG